MFKRSKKNVKLEFPPNSTPRLRACIRGAFDARAENLVNAEIVQRRAGPEQAGRLRVRIFHVPGSVEHDHRIFRRFQNAEGQSLGGAAGGLRHVPVGDIFQRAVPAHDLALMVEPRRGAGAKPAGPAILQKDPTFAVQRAAGRDALSLSAIIRATSSGWTCVIQPKRSVASCVMPLNWYHLGPTSRRPPSGPAVQGICGWSSTI